MTWKPSLVVRFPLEAPPRVEIEALYETDTARVVDWITAHPAWDALVQRAQELAEEARAA